MAAVVVVGEVGLATPVVRMVIWLATVLQEEGEEVVGDMEEVEEEGMEAAAEEVMEEVEVHTEAAVEGMVAEADVINLPLSTRVLFDCVDMDL